MDHTDCDPGDLLPPVIAVLDDAQTFVHRAGEE
jgi:hypothetical protein